MKKIILIIAFIILSSVGLVYSGYSLLDNMSTRNKLQILHRESHLRKAGFELYVEYQRKVAQCKDKLLSEYGYDVEVE